MNNKKKFIGILLVFLIATPVLGLAYLNNVVDKAIEENDLATQSKENNLADKDGEFGFNLPLIVIDTKGQVVNVDNKIKATMSILNNKQGDNYLSDIPELEKDIEIKVRGNSTRYYPKKQYSFEFVDKEGNDKSESLLGMKKESDWVLNAPFADKSLIRNYLIYNTTREIMDYSPKAEFCEVFVIDDGASELKKEHYKGVYVAIEKIKRDKNRVDIEKSNNKGEETSFIVAKDRAKAGDIFYRNYGAETYIYDYNIVNIYPKNPTKEQGEYINRCISEFERVLYSDKYDDPIEGYEKYIDVDSFVDYYIINEFTKNTDAGILSTYIHKDLGGKIKAGPIWDFNTSLGNYNIGDIMYMDPTGFYMVQKSWFDRLLMDKNFVDKVVSRYRILRQTYLSNENLIGNIDSTVKKLGNAIDRNFNVWPFWMCNQEKVFRTMPAELGPLGNDVDKIKEFIDKNNKRLEDVSYLANNYNEEIKMLKTFIIERGKWLDENIEYLYKFTE